MVVMVGSVHGSELRWLTACHRRGLQIMQLGYASVACPVAVAVAMVVTVTVVGGARCLELR